MNRDEILVVTGTLGDSASHLSRSLTELRQFTRLPFRQLVSDDGTAVPVFQERQQAVCRAHGADWTENPGPVWGISYNLNHLFEKAASQGYEWVFLVEDGVRPGQGWLETALDALERVGKRKWGSRSVGALGMASAFENWHLAGAGVLPGGATLGNTFAQHSPEIYEQFWGSSRYPEHWNDGRWCWQRMAAGMRRACESAEANHWPEIIQRTWRQRVLRGEIGAMQWTGHPYSGWQATAGWPVTRSVSWAWGPSAWGLHYLPAWREVGRFREGCTLYEGHLGVRLARGGWLSLNCECPPWLHQSGLAFQVKDQHKTPRHHESPDGVEGILERDFGVNGEDHVELADLARSYFKPGEIDAINRELSEIRLYADPVWEEYTDVPRCTGGNT